MEDPLKELEDIVSLIFRVRPSQIFFFLPWQLEPAQSDLSSARRLLRRYYHMRSSENYYKLRVGSYAYYIGSSRYIPKSFWCIGSPPLFQSVSD